MAQEKNRGGVAGQMDMFSMGTEDAEVLNPPEVNYPDIPEFTVKEKLMQEKESSGMYFSGHLLDGYARHVQQLSVTAIRDIVGEDAAVEERQTVRVAGIVTGISVKTTKKEEQMAFLTVEDRYAEIECLVFPRQYAQLMQGIRADDAIFVEGNLSFREEETPKILVSHIEPLVEDRLYHEKTAKEEAKSARVPDTAPAVQPVSRTPQSRGEEKPAASGRAYTKVYLRLDSFESLPYRKVTNLLDIFDDGSFAVILYDRSREVYAPFPHGVAMSDYVRREIEALIGKENVVFR